MTIPARFTKDDWMAEIAFMRAMVERGSAPGVPAESVASYLRTQSVGARKDNLPQLSDRLALAAHEWASGKYAGARASLDFAEVA